MEASSLTRFNSLSLPLFDFQQWGWYLSDDNRRYQLRLGQFEDQITWAEVGFKHHQYIVYNYKNQPVQSLDTIQEAFRWAEERVYFGVK